MKRILFKDGKKWCPSCQDWLPIDEFYLKKKSPGDRDCYCKKHRKEYDKKYNKRAYVRKHRYGLTQEEFDLVFKRQKGRCAICERKEDNPAVDHCHKTGKFRGLVCNACNLVLGRFKDDQRILEKAIKYLNQHSNGTPHHPDIEDHYNGPKPLSAGNTSGVKGVSWREDKKRWRAFNKKKHLGYFKTKEEAIKAVRQ